MAELGKRVKLEISQSYRLFPLHTSAELLLRELILSTLTFFCNVWFLLAWSFLGKKSWFLG